MSDPEFSFEKAKSRMPIDMSGPLSVIPDGTTLNAQVANTCLLKRERPNNTPMLISGVRNTVAILAWLRHPALTV
jgi:hypothetical protein